MSPLLSITTEIEKTQPIVNDLVRRVDMYMKLRMYCISIINKIINITTWEKLYEINGILNVTIKTIPKLIDNRGFKDPWGGRSF